MQTSKDPVGTVNVALAYAERLLGSNPTLAAEQATEILAAVPGHPAATLVLGVARRLVGDIESALQVLEPLTLSQPNWAAAHYQLGLARGHSGNGDAAVQSLRRAIELKPDLPDAWHALADHLTVIGDTAGADAAYAQHIRHSIRDPRLLEPAAALCENRIAVAERLLRRHLKQFPTDVAAIRMLAEVAARLARYADSEALLTRCLEEIERALAADPHNPGYRNLKAAILVRIGEYDQSLKLYANILSEYPRQPKVWMSYGHTLKTAGKQDESVAAYRKSIELAPELGEAWWSLANLKTLRFTDADMTGMRAQLERPDISEEDRFHFHFALGKALEDAGQFEESFRCYLEGNRLRRQGIRYDPDETSEHVRRSKGLFTRDFFAERAGAGWTAPDPIFIVSLPRSGSTLLEQILSSHSQVEGTMELPDIMSMSRTLGARKKRSQTSKYPETLANLDSGELATLGERYLSETRIQRKTDAPYFIDKMPNNFQHIGLIHLILPNAKIIDARRHPLACCFSGFKQHFARGQNFSYSLEDIGRYYRDYVELMAHFDDVLPGRVLRVPYEGVVEDTETQVRRLLDYCGLPFEDACLQFYNNPRAVRTASSEQVRTPIYREGIEHWRHFEPWLGPLKRVLGPVLDAYPAAPTF